MAEVFHLALYLLSVLYSFSLFRTAFIRITALEDHRLCTTNYCGSLLFCFRVLLKLLSANPSVR
jgi:hypothetical protein